jgi:hypothetical protein
MVTKSDVLTYKPVHFAQAVEHFGKTSASWEDASATQHAEAMALTSESWKGVAANAYQAVASADHATVMAASAQAGAAATLAGADGNLVWDAQLAAQYAIEDADAAGIDVSEGFQLTDRLPPMPGMTQARQAEMQFHASAIGAAVSNLVVQDQRAAAAMRAAGDFTPYHQPPNGHIQGMDNDLRFDPHGSNTQIPDPPPDQLEDGKQWWYHAGTGWKQDDHLHPCTGPQIAGDITSIATGAAAGPAIITPPGMVAEANAARGIVDLDQCEGP